MCCGESEQEPIVRGIEAKPSTQQQGLGTKAESVSLPLRTDLMTYEVNHRFLFNYAIESRLRERGVGFVWSFIRNMKPDLRRVSCYASLPVNV
jgi:hypothetical protein